MTESRKPAGQGTGKGRTMSTGHPGLESDTANEIHSVWNAVDNLREDVSTIKSSQAALIAKFDQIYSTITQLNKDRKPQYGVFIGAMGVLVTIVTTCGAAALAPLYRNDVHHSQNLARHVEEIRADILESEGRSIERQAEVREEISLLASTTQRAMEIERENSEDRIESLKEILKLEVQLRNEITQEKIDSLEAILAKVVREQEQRTGRVYSKE